MVESLGKHKPTSILNVLSTIGDKILLPEPICWLVDIFKSEENTTLALSYPSAERMVKRLFYNHISKIKNDKMLIDDYVWILNRMVDFGSSEAYLFRENVITYKKT